MMEGKQTHLTHRKQVDLGSFYTPGKLVDIVYDMLNQFGNDLANSTILDSSCGYGNFLQQRNDLQFGARFVGADIDEAAIHEAEKMCSDVKFVKTNSLVNVSRKKYGLSEIDKLVIVGNPPYNDVTSIIRQSTKDKAVTSGIDADIQTRDLGISFLLSYAKLRADYICVLHPLSYLIKKANFKLLRKFTEQYCLKRALVVSSHEFADTSAGMAFPIVIALYKRGAGMDYEYIENFKFSVDGGHKFVLSEMDSIANYVTKYPNKKSLRDKSNVMALFYTMRDINALRRNRTFIDKEVSNAIYVTRDKFAYYCYIDVFKQFADRVPYYFGNCDVIINENKFREHKEAFISYSIHHNPVLSKRFKFKTIPNSENIIDNYMKELLGDHYICPEQ